MFHPFRRLSRVAVIAGVGAAAAYLFDPEAGEERRRLVTRRLGSLRESAMGAKGRLTPDSPGGSPEDATPDQAGPHGPGLDLRVGNDWRPEFAEPTASHVLEDKVRSEVLGHGRFPDLAVVVNDVGGVIEMRGEVTDDSIRSDLVAQVGRVEGVHGVRDLTHLPGEPPPNKVPPTGSVTSAS